MMEIAMRMPDLATVDDTIKVVGWLAEVGQPSPPRPAAPGSRDRQIDHGAGVDRDRHAPGDRGLSGRGGGSRPGHRDIRGRRGPTSRTRAASGSRPTGEFSSDTDRAMERVADGRPEPESAQPSRPQIAESADRVSFFERNRQARTGSPPAAIAADYSREFLLDLYRRMVLIREFEEGVKFLFLEGAMPGTIHQCQGQEATAVGVCAALEEGDFITSTFRGHGHALAKGLTPEELLFELFGASTGCCRGKGGSMHVGNMDKGMVPGIAIVGGGIPLAAGMALALKMQKSRAIVACFFGDGAVAEGAFHEGINLAAIWDLPVMFVCENNLYGASTRVDLCDAEPADRRPRRGLRHQGRTGRRQRRAGRLRGGPSRRPPTAGGGQGPVLLELLTYRRTGHSRRDACHYQAKEEREEWFARDPIERLGRLLIERGLAGQTDLDDVRTEAQRGFQAAVELARQQPMPSPDDLTTDVFA